MVEPVTGNKTLIVPNTGDLPGAWGTAALNPNFLLIDAMFGGVTTISLGAATTITLTAPATTGAPGAVPQSSNAMIRFTGTPTGDAVINFSLPGFYIIDNQCAMDNDTVIELHPAGAGGYVAAPPFQKIQIFYDGTDIDYVNLGMPGTALDLHGYTTTARWMRHCSLDPYLVKDGSSHSTAIYPALAFALAGNFGNSAPPGLSFFLPDERARARIAFDFVQPASGATSARITQSIAGFAGNTMGAAGGDQRMQSHTHSNTLSDPGHLHVQSNRIATASVASGGGSGNIWTGDGTANTGTASTGVSLTNVNQGTGSSQNMQPSIISFVPLIKT